MATCRTSFTQCANTTVPLLSLADVACTAQGICNLCDYPAAVFPVTKVDPAVDVKAEPHEFSSDFDKINYERCA